MPELVFTKASPSCVLSVSAIKKGRLDEQESVIRCIGNVSILKDSWQSVHFEDEVVSELITSGLIGEELGEDGYKYYHLTEEGQKLICNGYLSPPITPPQPEDCG